MSEREAAEKFFREYPATVRNPGREALRIAISGGEPMDGPRYIWWNFVSSRRERIEQAKADWTRDRFGVVVPGTLRNSFPCQEKVLPSHRTLDVGYIAPAGCFTNGSGNAR